MTDPGLDIVPISHRQVRAEREARIANAPHFVYRCYSEHDALLYVGCSVDVAKRLRGHRRESDEVWLPSTWIGATKLVTTEAFPDRETARAAEAAAIRDERPIFNVQHGTRGDVRQCSFAIREHEPAQVPA